MIQNRVLRVKSAKYLFSASCELYRIELHIILDLCDCWLIFRTVHPFRCKVRSARQYRENVPWRERKKRGRLSITFHVILWYCRLSRMWSYNSKLFGILIGGTRLVFWSISMRIPVWAAQRIWQSTHLCFASTKTALQFDASPMSWWISAVFCEAPNQWIALLTCTF